MSYERKLHAIWFVHLKVAEKTHLPTKGILDSTIFTGAGYCFCSSHSAQDIKNQQVNAGHGQYVTVRRRLTLCVCLYKSGDTTLTLPHPSASNQWSLSKYPFIFTGFFNSNSLRISFNLVFGVFSFTSTS